MLSNHLRFGLPLVLFHGTTSPSLYCPHILLLFSIHVCPYHFNLLSCTLFDISLTFVVPLILSLLILFSLVISLIHRNILISATSNVFSYCDLFTAHVPASYITAGLTAVLHILSRLTLKLVLRSHRTSDTRSFRFAILIVF